MIQKTIMLACDLLLIVGLFGMSGYYYSANQVAAGEWYMLQYDVDVIASNVHLASTTRGQVNMTLTLPPQSYISITNNNALYPSYGVVHGQKSYTEKSLEWLIINTTLVTAEDYNQLGYVKGTITQGVGVILKYILLEQSDIVHTQYTAPTYSHVIDNTGVDGDEYLTIYLTLDGSQRILYNGRYYNVVRVTYSSTTPP
jgi:hypothetical protein